MAVARELTKLHEEIWRGTIGEARVYFQEQTPRGEFTLVIAGHSSQDVRWTDQQLDAAIQVALQENQTASQAASQIAARSGWPRRIVYGRIIQSREDSNGPE